MMQLNLSMPEIEIPLAYTVICVKCSMSKALVLSVLKQLECRKIQNFVLIGFSYPKSDSFTFLSDPG